LPFLATWQPNLPEFGGIGIARHAKPATGVVIQNSSATMK